MVFRKPLSDGYNSQNKFDNNWILPRGNLGGIWLNFDNNSLHVDYFSDVNLRGLEANLTVSDKVGNLLFYSNNCSIANSEHATMEDGEGLNPGIIQTYWCEVNPFANPYSQSIIALPKPDDSTLFLLFHADSELFNLGGPGGGFATPKNLLLTQVDINENNGLGKVIEKNIPVLTDTLASAKLSAVKHANGRDWWLIAPEYKSNCYYTILISPDDNLIINKQCAGYVWNRNDEAGGTLFTPKGDKFIRANDMNGLNIFDFDRCTGILFNPIHIPLSPDTNAITSLSISPSGRFLYFNTLQNIYQFDLLAPDIAGSKTLVASYDGFVNASNPTNFYHARLAPDGKIYICTFGPTNFLHTINNPDSLGIGCQVLQHNIQLPITHYAAVPNYPNYRLGALQGPCDTLISEVSDLPEERSEVYIYPNPTFGKFQIKGEQLEVIDIFDLTGEHIYTHKLTGEVNNIDIGEYALSGIYLIRVTDTHGSQYVKRLIVFQ